MHAVDLIEDAAVAYGYEHITPELVPTFTVGSPRAIEEQAAIARRVLTGLGFPPGHDARAYQRGSRLPQMAAGAGREHGEDREPHQRGADHLPRFAAAGLLETMAINRQYDLPQHLFEVGDCSFVDPGAETGAREERFIAAAMIGTHVGYADIRAVADAFVHEMGRTYVVKPIEHASLIPGRAAGLFDARRGKSG
jgi:phenylalanyl-tRNA synthetase beta chain